MISKNFNYLLTIIFISSLTLSVYAEEKIDIWNNKKITETSQTKEQDQPEKVNQLNSQAAEKILPSQTIKIENGLLLKDEEKKVLVFMIHPILILIWKCGHQLTLKILN